MVGTFLIVSVSGIRGIPTEDLSLEEVSRLSRNFARVSGSQEVLLARDTRSTGEVIVRAVSAAITGRGLTLVDFGVASTPALFRESLLRGKPAIMVTASHNEPEFNGLKFMIDGKGIVKDTLDSVVAPEQNGSEPLQQGRIRMARTSYVDDLVRMFGENSCEGVKVALDLGGGAAIAHAVPLLRRLGCFVTSVNDTPGLFNRRIDPTVDELQLLRRIVTTRQSDVGLGFDCDGDRLVIVDDAGNKRTGDFMLTLALAQLLPASREKCVVASMDTTQAVDEVAEESGARVVRSRVGEANVVSKMAESEARFGGEGSSGGLIDGSFNYCRDSMLAALVIIKALKQKKRGIYKSVKSYHQTRSALQIPRSKALRAIRTLASKNPDSDTTDGVKIWVTKKSWVLLRASGTEDAVRVSAEAETATRAAQIVQSYSNKLKELSK
jgi:phosphomannomutase